MIIVDSIHVSPTLTGTSSSIFHFTVKLVQVFGGSITNCFNYYFGQRVNMITELCNA